MASCQFDLRRKELQRNLCNLYRCAQPIDITQGEMWYPNARRIVHEWAATYGIPSTTVACVIAAISPLCEWTRNLIIAEDILARRPPSVGGIPQNIRKAQRIFNDSAHDTLAYFLAGPKVASFAQNLAGSDTIVTVDTHAAQAALNDVRATVRLKWTPYTVFAECYAAVAHDVDMMPATFQAIIWHVWKRLYPRTVKRGLRKHWEPIGDY